MKRLCDTHNLDINTLVLWYYGKQFRGQKMQQNKHIKMQDIGVRHDSCMHLVGGSSDFRFIPEEKKSTTRVKATNQQGTQNGGQKSHRNRENQPRMKVVSNGPGQNTESNKQDTKSAQESAHKSESPAKTHLTPRENRNHVISTPSGGISNRYKRQLTPTQLSHMGKYTREKTPDYINYPPSPRHKTHNGYANNSPQREPKSRNDTQVNDPQRKDL